VLKISPPLGFDPRTVQLVASRYTDWAKTAHRKEFVNLGIIWNWKRGALVVSRGLMGLLSHCALWTACMLPGAQSITFSFHSLLDGRQVVAWTLTVKAPPNLQLTTKATSLSTATVRLHLLPTQQATRPPNLRNTTHILSFNLTSTLQESETPPFPVLKFTKLTTTDFGWHFIWSIQETFWEMAVPCLRRLVAGLSPRRPGFDPGSVNVGFVVDKVALGQVFLRVLRFSPVNFIPPAFHYIQNQKKWIIFITGLHNKPQGCGASVASAAGPFTKKSKNIGEKFLCILNP
jgi:hypothetical protein